MKVKRLFWSKLTNFSFEGVKRFVINKAMTFFLEFASKWLCWGMRTRRSKSGYFSNMKQCILNVCYWRDLHIRTKTVKGFIQHSHRQSEMLNQPWYQIYLRTSFIWSRAQFILRTYPTDQLFCSKYKQTNKQSVFGKKILQKSWSFGTILMILH